MYSTHNAFSALLLMVYQALVCDDFLCVITDLFDGTPLKCNAEPLHENERLSGAITSLKRATSRVGK